MYLHCFFNLIFWLSLVWSTHFATAQRYTQSAQSNAHEQEQQQHQQQQQFALNNERQRQQQCNECARHCEPTQNAQNGGAEVNPYQQQQQQQQQQSYQSGPAQHGRDQRMHFPQEDETRYINARVAQPAQAAGNADQFGNRNYPENFAYAQAQSQAHNLQRQLENAPVMANVAGPGTAGTALPAQQQQQAKPSFMDEFSMKLQQVIAPAQQRTNCVYSPFSLQLLLAIVHAGASGQTEQELQNVLKFPAQKSQVAAEFKRALAAQAEQQSPKAKLVSANKMFVNRRRGGEIRADFKDYAAHNFNADIAAVDVQTPKRSAQRINDWIAGETEGRITNLVQPEDLNANTEALLVNALYFKAKWAIQFSDKDTAPAAFYNADGRVTEAQMMYNDDAFNYAELPDFDAKALELPYADSDLSMLLLLPNKRDGLSALQQRMAQVPLSAIAARLRRDTVTVHLPKFRIKFNIDMVTPLKMLGVERIFADVSEIDNILTRPVKVSKIQQQAYININEAGSEATAATYAKFVPLSLAVEINKFNADHPFMFVIRNQQAIFFIGHVVNL